jgi:hypothetical protein
VSLVECDADIDTCTRIYTIKPSTQQAHTHTGARCTHRRHTRTSPHIATQAACQCDVSCSFMLLLLLATLTPKDKIAEASTRTPNSRMGNWTCPPSTPWYLKERQKMRFDSDSWTSVKISYNSPVNLFCTSCKNKKREGGVLAKIWHWS